MNGVVPWSQWLAALHAFQGIAHDRGFIPLHSIRYCVHLDEAGEPAQQYEGNVVPLKRSP